MTDSCNKLFNNVGSKKMTLKSLVCALSILLVSSVAIADDSMSILINQKLYAAAYKPDTMLDLIETLNSASQRDSGTETVDDDETTIVVITDNTRTY